VTGKLCVCHGEPCYWQRDKRVKAGGWWECPVKRAEYNATRSSNPERSDGINQRRRDKYDGSAIFRIDENLRSRRRKALRARERQHKRLTEED
jgi:hypothetical protein